MTRIIFSLFALSPHVFPPGLQLGGWQELKAQDIFGCPLFQMFPEVSVCRSGLCPFPQSGVGQVAEPGLPRPAKGETEVWGRGT